MLAEFNGEDNKVALPDPLRLAAVSKCRAWHGNALFGGNVFGHNVRVVKVDNTHPAPLETYSIGVSITPYIQVGTWEIVIEATGAAETLDQSLATIINVIEELTANGPTDTDFAQAKSVARDDYQLDNNYEIIGPLLLRRHLPDALVGTPSQRLQALSEITAADIQQLVALLVDIDNRIEVFRTVEL